MKKRVPDKFWFPWWPDKWIFGSVRIEFTVAERGIWVDMLSLASKDDGHIRANEETPYPLAQLAGMLIIPEKELDAAINKFIKKTKLNKMKDGTLYVTKWEKYQFSESYHRVQKHREKEAESRCGNGKKLQCNEEALPYYNKINHSILNNNKVEKITFDFDERKFLYITIEDKAGWFDAYPACDIDQELREMREWLLANPTKKKSNYRKFITNWLSREQDKGGTRKEYKTSQVGESTHTPSKKEDDYTKARTIKMKELEKKYQPEIDKAKKAKSSDWMDEIDNKIKEEIAEFSREYHKNN
jgi:hypothetical protein